MITFKQFLLEIFNYKAELIKRNDLGVDGDVFTFTVSNTIYFLYIRKITNDYEVTFGAGDPKNIMNSITNRTHSFHPTELNKDQFKVISSVVNGLIDYFKINPLMDKQKIFFSADTTTRIKLYRSITRRIAQKHNLIVKEISSPSKTYFIIGKP